MERDEEFGGVAQREMYPLFHEAVSQPLLREWLGWNDKTFQFENADNRNWFYELLSPTEGDDGDSPARVTTSAQVRVLKDILASDEARAVLKDPARSFEDAHRIAVAEELVENWPSELAEAVRALDSIPALALQSLDQDRLGLIQKIRDKADGLLKAHSRLQS
jgi:hypothetical protein